MGPLHGIRVIELAGLGPGPFCCMLLADLGADVIRVDRPTPAMTLSEDARLDVMGRNKRSIVLDLKQASDRERLWKLIGTADALVEGMRPGVMEKLGFGPTETLERHPSLVYGRMTGFGQHGPLASAAGHDINYLALTGLLGAIGPKERPVIPLNLVADFGGGALYLALGLVSALLHVKQGGRGQVVDATMIDGASSLSAMFYGLSAMKQWQPKREANFLDGGAHFYNVYETKDGEWVSVGAIEPQFYAVLLRGLGVDPEQYEDYLNPARWPAWKQDFAAIFKTKTRAEWDSIFLGTDACYAPVLELSNAHQHPHNVARGTFVTEGGVLQPGPAPRFSHTPGSIRRPPPANGQHTDEILAELADPGSD